MDQHTRQTDEAAVPSVHRIAIAHGSPLLAAGLATTLSRWGHEVLATGPSKPSADLVVTDRKGAQRTLAVGGTACGVMVLDTGFNGQEVRRLLDLGALACLEAGCLLEDLAQAVQAAGRGERYLCAAVCAVLIDDVVHVELTHRESEVLHWVSEGLDNKSIALRLGLASTTVKTHIKALLKKTSARSRTQLATTAVRKGWVSPR